MDDWLIFYPTSDTEQYQLMILHGFVVNQTDYEGFNSVLCALTLLGRTYYVILCNPE